MDPSLKRLPDPDPAPQSLHRFYDGYHLGLLLRPRPQSQPQLQGGVFLRPHCSYRAQEEEHVSYVVAGLFRKHKPSATGHLFDLYLYSSDTNKWSIQDQEAPLLLLQHQQQRAGAGGGFDFVTHKAISIGGEHATMCFVDLQQGILQCNVLDSTPGLRYYPMPPPLEPNPVTMVQSYPQVFRDVAIIDGGRRIKCAQLHLDVTLNCEDSNWGDWTVPSYHGWKAATWSMDTAHPSSGWRQDSEVVHAFEIGSTIDPALLQLPPHEFDGDQGPTLPLTFEKLHTSLPVISLHDDGKDVVYFMTKVHSYHKAALVIAVDMSNKTAQQVTQFLPGKFMERAFVHSRISKYLSMAPTPAPDIPVLN
ncbi:hypothetical protein TRIUR3_26375 [Triticum urartu]|uniref:Uncharacterized protein n=1 Tax=Triticum urartu TaxID=4572 RepID=M7Z1T5_TRIUA|nr:hypothetical protein TRIUR3_26375 [Triticum urartu]